MRLTDVQMDRLLRPINPKRVQKLQGSGHSYVEAHDIRAMLIRIFGFAGWSLIETSPAVCIYDDERKLGNGKPGVAVAYRAHLELVIHTSEGDARYAGSAVGEAVQPDYNRGDAHDQALKSAESGALKRAATNLGDQFGLSLYRNGSTAAFVQTVFGYDPNAAEPVDEIAASPGDPPPQDGQAPAPAQVVPQPASGVGDPVQLEMLPRALDDLNAEERQRLASWARERGVKNVRQPGDKVNDVLRRCEELVAARG